MKILGLFRHAKSDWDDMAKRDFDRGLNDRGRRGAKLMGDHIRTHGTKWGTVIASPAERNRLTMEAAMPDADVQYDKRIYIASSDTILETVADLAGDSKSVLVSGHNPGMQEVLLELVSEEHENKLFFEAARKFPTAAFAVLELDIDEASTADTAVKLVARTFKLRDLCIQLPAN